jgi:Tfp pilus assembly protein PilX
MKAHAKGAALAVAMVLLTGLSALALAAAAAAITALAMAGYQQAEAVALEAAEAGIAQGIRAATEHAGTGVAAMPHLVGGTTVARFESRTTEQNGEGALPAGFSLGTSEGAFESRHFLIVSQGWAARDVRVRLEQGFYVVAPAHD